jgi:hypothetical protein
VDAREARAEGGGGAFGVGDEGEVAGEELADETGDWGVFRGVRGWRMAVAANEDDVGVTFGVPGESLCDALTDAGGAVDEDADGCLGRVPGRV